MLNFFILCGLLCGAFQGMAQPIHGRILDSLTREPITYAHIVYGDKKVAYTNQLGEFTLGVNGYPVTIVVSHISYGQKKTTIHENPGTLPITLRPLSRLLPELTVTTMTPAGILKAAWQRNKEFVDVVHQGKAFYRQINKTDSAYTEVHEVFYNLTYTNQGIVKWKLEQGRFAQRTTFESKSSGAPEKVVAIRNFSSLSKIAKMFYTSANSPFYRSIQFPVSGKVNELYDVELKDVLQKDGESFLSFYCRPKPKTQHLPIFEGTIVLRERDYALTSFEGLMKDPFGIDRTIGKQYKTRNHHWQVTMTYELDSSISKNQLNFISVVNTFDYFNENFKLWHNLTTSSSLFLFEFSDQISDKDFLENNRKNLTQKDIDLINALEYNSDFWRENQVVKRTPIEEEVIASFEKRKAFQGKLFKENN